MAHPGDRLPATDASFVGRDAARSAITSAFASARLVTLVGPAGVGKTRLAIEWARARVKAPGPALFCDLGGATTLGALCREIGDVLDVPLLSGEPHEHLERLARSLHARGRILIIADELDAAIEPARVALEAWLASATELRVLLTSRQRLGLAAEHVVEVAPLAPEEARALFVERASRVSRRFVPTPAMARAIDAIVERLDGLPLAIELASARVAVASPAQIAPLLDRQLDLLVDAGRDVARHRTLRAAIDNSWSLLGEAERRALARASLFEGAFVLEAADAIALPEPDPMRRRVAALDGLQALAERSLIALSVDDEGARRFRLLAAVREYAQAALHASGEREAAVREHAQAVLGYVEALAARARREPAALRALLAETRELDRVLASAIEDGRAEDAVRAFVAVGHAYQLRGPGRPYLAVAARLEPLLDAVAPLMQGHAWAMRARVATRVGELRPALAAFERAIVLLDRVDASLSAALRSRVAGIRDLSGDEAGARAMFAEIVEEGARGEDRALIETSRGLWAMRHEDSALAEAALTRALEHARRAGDRCAEGACLGYLAWCDLRVARLPAARERFAQAASILAEMGDRRMSVAHAGDVGLVLTEEGEIDAARTRLLAALAAHRELGDRWYEAEREGELGNLELLAGRLDEAERRLRLAVELMGEVADDKQAAVFRSWLALCLAESGRVALAEETLDEVAEEIARFEPRTVELQRRYIAIVKHRGEGELERRLEEARLAALAVRSEPHIGTRMAGRLLMALTERLAARLDAPAAIVVGREGDWIQAGGARAAIEGAAPRRMLAVLARARLDRPGAALALDALFDAGWPGEEAAASKRVNRVRVALTRLRQAGLREVLASRKDGYLLDPTVPLEIAG